MLRTSAITYENLAQSLTRNMKDIAVSERNGALAIAMPDILSDGDRVSLEIRRKYGGVVVNDDGSMMPDLIAGFHESVYEAAEKILTEEGFLYDPETCEIHSPLIQEDALPATLGAMTTVLKQIDTLARAANTRKTP